MSGNSQHSSGQGSAGPGSGAEYYREPEGGARGADADRSADPQSDGLLDAVVRETVVSREELARLSHQEREALIAAARRLESEGADPLRVAQELTRTIVTIRFPVLATDRRRQDEVIARVAEDLAESPISVERLGRLWQLLLQADVP
ncbi:MAG: hypothetical protein U0795_20765 [Pirellulales bacterium]